MKAGRNKTGYVGHIHHQDSTYLVSDLSHSLKIDLSGIGACPRDDQLRFAFQGKFPYLVIIDDALVIHTVRHTMVVLSGHVDRTSMGEMAAVV